MYVEQGDLIVRTHGNVEHPVLFSTEGVRQGDVLGPLLFCLALKPAVERTMKRFAEKFPDRQVQFFAYMDDITIVGKADECVEAFAILEEELAALSLMVNKGKTVTTSPDIGAALGCEVDDCPKLLGAFVSRTLEKEKAHIDELPATHETFFNRLPKLPAEVAYRLLIHCGVPRWAHLIRTHEPAVVKPASAAFTEMSLRCLCAILRVDFFFFF